MFKCLAIFAIISFPLSVYADTIPIIGECGSLNSTDLSTQMAYEIDSRISGVTASDATKMLWSTRGNGTGGWARSGTVWTEGGTTPLDFTGASPWNSSGGMTMGGTLISPKHIMFANHFPIPNGSTIIFVDNANNIVSRTVVDQVQVAIDIQVAVLNEDVPPEIAYYPIVDLATFQNYWKTVPGTPAIVLDQEDKALIKDISGVVSYLIYYPGSLVAPRSDFDETIIGGDSGNPVFGVIGGRLVLLSTIYTAAYGTFSSYLADQINDAMTTLGGGYQISTLDLSCFTAQSAPAFSVESTTFSIAEDSVNETEIGSVLATSDDPVVYSFISGNTDNVFLVNPNTGVIKVNNQLLLDYENTPTYTLTERAQVTGSSWYWPINPDYDTTTVIINLTEVNEAPSFSSSSYSFSIAENSSTSSSVGSVSATDPDVGQTISYQILSGNTDNVFAISATSGEITVANGSLLNYDTHNSYSLVVEASDNGATPLSATVSVTVNISEYNPPSGGGGGGGSKKKKKEIVPTNTVCRVGDKFSTTTGLPCTSFTLSPSNPSTISGPTVAPQTPGLATCAVTLTLRQGNTGDQVKCLQNRLNITADGIFGPMTKAAVIAFQKLHNLVPDGIVGPLTRGEINKI